MGVDVGGTLILGRVCAFPQRDLLQDAMCVFCEALAHDEAAEGVVA